MQPNREANQFTSGSIPPAGNASAGKNVRNLRTDSCGTWSDRLSQRGWHRLCSGSLLWEFGPLSWLRACTESHNVH